MEAQGDSRPPLKPNEGVQRALLSTTSRMFGIYETEEVRIDHAWLRPGDDDQMHRWSEGPTSRSTYVLSFLAPGPERRPGVALPEYSGAGDYAAATMSVLFGTARWRTAASFGCRTSALSHAPASAACLTTRM